MVTAIVAAIVIGPLLGGLNLSLAIWQAKEELRVLSEMDIPGLHACVESIEQPR